MKNIDLREFAGKDIAILLKKADELFIGSLEEKIHSHKIYSNILEQLPIDYDQIKLRELRGILRQKIWILLSRTSMLESFLNNATQER